MDIHLGSMVAPHHYQYTNQQVLGGGRESENVVEPLIWSERPNWEIRSRARAKLLAVVL